MIQDLNEQLNELLENAVAAGTEQHRELSFKRRVGYGNRPAIVHIDVANAWTREGHGFSCENTVEDAIAEGFRPIVIREAVGDRVAGTVAWNLFDMDSKFGDLEPLSNVLHYLNKLPKFRETTTP